ncbi:Hypothetical predicted protein [Mytilus galloprovincialis]|uniref:Uncharacterized protein n=1 Tax=Mytilus galloprovincialis TaxID=29158 RepID=A0A8B6EVV8_MYTGA|nr:Hypothetical predicted protein [Mytilus galloprovincialis]
MSETGNPTEKIMSQNQTPSVQSVESSQSQELCTSTEYTGSQKSVISLSTTSISQTNSQSSVISLSTELSEDDMFNNVSTEPSDSDTCSTSTPNQFIDLRNFYPSVVRYCQGLTVLTGSSNKTSSTMTDIQILMTNGSDKRLLPENMPTYFNDPKSSLESGQNQPAYVLLKSNKVICILIDNIEPGQYILKRFCKKVKVMHEKVVTDKDLKNVNVSKAIVSKYSGPVTDDYQGDSQIFILGSFHKQPLNFKMISTHQPLSTKLALLEQDETQTLLEQTSSAKHDQIFLQMINNAVKQMKTVTTKKSRKKKLKSDINNNLDGLENDFNEPVKKKPKFQLRIVLKNKGISLKKSKTNLSQDNH